MSRDALTTAGLAAGLTAPALIVAGLVVWVRPDAAPGVPGLTLVVAGVGMLLLVALAVSATSALHRPARPPDPLAATSYRPLARSPARAPPARPAGPAHAQEFGATTEPTASAPLTVVRKRRRNGGAAARAANPPPAGDAIRA